jgi:hypothetical protein
MEGQGFNGYGVVRRRSVAYERLVRNFLKKLKEKRKEGQKFFALHPLLEDLRK